MIDSIDDENLQNLSKEELIVRIKTLKAHNTQLKNILAKNDIKKTNNPQKAFNFDSCNYRHILLKFYYLGWDYHGFAIQEDNFNTIENHLFKALTKTCLIEDRSKSNYHRCGRTDKGVSAFGQVISITVRSRCKKEDQNNIQDEINYCKVLNRVLPDDIQCIGWCPIENDFSARFDCKRRVYKYFFPKGNLDIELMRTASKCLLGTHDFRNFCKMDVANGVIKFIRNINNIDINCEDTDENNIRSIYTIKFEGNAFLWHQIRCIVGVLFLIGQKKEPPEVINELLNVEANPRKPEYNMASEVPLNLFECDYEKSDWIYDEESLKTVLEKLRTMWTFAAIKESMIKSMLNKLENLVKEPNDEVFTEALIQGVKAKKYTPLMKRQRCESLEDRIEHFKKRNCIKKIQEESQP